MPVQHVDDASLNTAHNGIFLEASAMAVGTGAVNVDADVKDKAMGSARKKGKEARKVRRYTPLIIVLRGRTRIV